MAAPVVLCAAKCQPFPPQSHLHSHAHPKDYPRIPEDDDVSPWDMAAPARLGLPFKETVGSPTNPFASSTQRASGRGMAERRNTLPLPQRAGSAGAGSGALSPTHPSRSPTNRLGCETTVPSTFLPHPFPSSALLSIHLTLSFCPLLVVTAAGDEQRQPGALATRRRLRRGRRSSRGCHGVRGGGHPTACLRAGGASAGRRTFDTWHTWARSNRTRRAVRSRRGSGRQT